jgi:hypothetical protein
MAKRHYESGSRVGHQKEKFNDEWRNDKDGYEMAPEYGRGADYFPTMSGEGRRGIEKPGMIYEDRRAIANFPQEVMMKPYPMTGPWMPEDLDDTGKGVERQMDYDDAQRRSGFYPKKV